MALRVGSVTNVFPETATLEVTYEDLGVTTLPLPMITMNREFSMPEVGDMVLVEHLENGMSEGFVIGTYYNEELLPKTEKDYRKEFGKEGYIEEGEGEYKLFDKKKMEFETPFGKLAIGEDGATLECDADITLKASEVRFIYGGKSITVSQIVKRIEALEARL